MIRVYNGEELPRERRKKRLLMTIWYVVLGVYVLATAGFLVWYCFVDYDSPWLMGIQIIETALTAVFAMFTFLYFSIPFRRERRYVKLLEHLDTGLKEFGKGKFLRFIEKLEVRDGVDFRQMITEEWSERRQEFMERKVLLDAEKPYPDVLEGEQIMYTTQGNVLVEYEVVPEADKEKPASAASEEPFASNPQETDAKESVPKPAEGEKGEEGEEGKAPAGEKK